MFKKRFQTKVQRQKQVISRLKNENKKLKDRIKILEIRDKEKDKIIEELKLQIEELREIIFGGPKNDNRKKSSDKESNRSRSRKSKRPSSSYRRPLPKEEEITDTQDYPLFCCPECNGKITNLKIIERYVEDILPINEWYKVLKKVIKERIRTGYCIRCKKRVSAKAISPQLVSLGDNLKKFVAFATVILRLSYEQVEDFLEGSLGIKISDGEVSNILEKQAIQLNPAFERLKTRIRGHPSAHFDETGWKVQSSEQGNHAWVMTGTETEDAIFLLGQSRGKGNIVKLRGKDNKDQIGISDDYNAYKNAFSCHALCWAHPHRKLRDLKNSKSLDAEKRNHCEQVYKSFVKLYSEVQDVVDCPFSFDKRSNARDDLASKFEKIVKPHRLDPTKLVNIKKRLSEQKDCYFVCIMHPNIPTDNNKAERALRHLVLKRKNSYGSKTQQGADKMSVLYSVLLSLWWKSKDTFFREYSQLF